MCCLPGVVVMTSWLSWVVIFCALVCSVATCFGVSTCMFLSSGFLLFLLFYIV
ncbi:hypothetical protein BTHERMOSOX_80 [Bathymodiolus thermophilus thioautotrophic gill symbiont]|nr:hypothetical protein BTHERMOSOX_80 [Bathymodiolus thermophilus thioautotrophic gill symbiont]